MAKMGSDFSDELALWYRSANGQYLQARLQQALPAILANIAGSAHLLISLNDDIDCDKISHRAKFSDVFAADASEHFLPEGFDSVILWHSLDASCEPARILHLGAALTAKSGYLVIIGFNPRSLFGLLHLPMRWLGRNPYQSGFYHKKRVIDWLHVLNYQLRLQSTVAFLPPRWTRFRVWAALERLLLFLFPYWGGVQILIAKRPWFPLTPVGGRQLPNPLAIFAKPEPKPATRDIQQNPTHDQ